MVTYGYIRVSSADQNDNRQTVAMSELNIPRRCIFADKQSGNDFHRPAYIALIEKLSPGDLLYVKSIDRLGRNYDEILTQWRLLTRELGVDIAVIDMPLLDTRNGKDLLGIFMADLVLQILSFVAHNERDEIKKRQAEGIAAARARGASFGRPRKNSPEEFAALVKDWERGKLPTKDLIAKTGLSESTLYRRLRECSAKKQK